MQMILNKKLRLTRNQKGMTLIELMAVVVILGILAAVAGAAVTSGFSKSKISSDAQTRSIVEDALMKYVLDENKVLSPTDTTLLMSDLTAKGYLTSSPKWANSQAIWSVSAKYTDSANKTLIFTYAPAAPAPSSY